MCDAMFLCGIESADLANEESTAVNREYTEQSQTLDIDKVMARLESEIRRKVEGNTDQAA